MNKLILLTFIFITQFTFFAQKSNYPFNKWTEDELLSAKVEDSIIFLNEVEKEVVYYSNLVRINPPLFAKTYLAKYVDSMKISNKNVKSLNKTLKSTKKMSPLSVDLKLVEMSKDHATKSGKSGKEGHQNFASRAKKFLKNKYNPVAENCEYGSQNAMQIVMNLLIDEANPDFLHRKNFLNFEFNSIGVSIQPHKKHKTNCVIEFGKLN
jgi:uncharacterized protein YkwD